MSQDSAGKALVSVIIPSYNSADFLEEAIRSAVDQTYPELEIVVIDDSSTDRTAELAQNWRRKTSKINYLRHDSNRGLSAARNTGIKHARGEYIAFLDADDVWLPNKLAIQVREIDRLQVDLVFANWFVWDGVTKELAMDLDCPRIFTKEHGLSDFIGKNYGQPSTALIRKSALEKIGNFDETLRSSEDYDLWLRLLAGGLSLALIPEPLAYYRRHSSQMSARTYTMRTSRLAVFKKLVRIDPLLLFRCPVLVKKLILHQGYQMAHKLLPNKG
jgi:teichuronic acid biosynthesis glycosyltransferase TuaG